MHYHIGWNLTGYLPEMDPYIVGDIETALSSMSDEIEQVVDSLASVVDALDDDTDCASVEELRDAKSLLEELKAIYPPWSEEDKARYSAYGWDGTIRYVHYWIMPCPIDACETDYCAECGQDITAYWRDARGESTCEECERELFETQEKSRLEKCQVCGESRESHPTILYGKTSCELRRDGQLPNIDLSRWLPHGTV